MMKSNEMIERYVYAVTRRISRKIRADVATELNSIISDMLEERCGEIIPNEHDVRVVLTELGTPSELAEKYSPNSNKSFITPPYYAKYIFVLKIVVICVAGGMLIVAPLSAIVEGKAWYIGLLRFITGIFTGEAVAFTVVTLLFAYFCHKGISINISIDNLDELPPVPRQNEVISKGECIADIVVSIVFAVIFLLLPQIFVVSGLMTNGEMVSIFNPNALWLTWAAIALLVAISIFAETIKMMEGRYTKRVMITAIVANGASAVLACIWLLTQRLINPQSIEALKQLFVDKGILLNNFASPILSNLQYFILAIIIFSLALDTAITVRKTMKAKEHTKL